MKEKIRFFIVEITFLEKRRAPHKGKYRFVGELTNKKKVMNNLTSKEKKDIDLTFKN